jgi:hypothetical protein
MARQNKTIFLGLTDFIYFDEFLGTFELLLRNITLQRRWEVKGWASPDINSKRPLFCAHDQIASSIQNSNNSKFQIICALPHAYCLRQATVHPTQPFVRFGDRAGDPSESLTFTFQLPSLTLRINRYYIGKAPSSSCQCQIRAWCL